LPQKFAPDKLREHFQKHGRGVGATTAAEYEEMAGAFLGEPQGPHIHCGTDSSGDQLRFCSRSGRFAAFKADGTIKTFHVLGNKRNKSALQQFREKIKR
jgi:pyocin large subunit-like protein